MRILILTFYFQPDLCAGSFRNTAFVESLLKKIGKNDKVDVFTSMPNRYASFNIESKPIETKDNLTIFRIKLPDHKNKYLDQIISFKHYFFEVISQTNKKKYDLVYASSSRLFTAFLGAYISSRKKIPLFLDLRDIFIDIIKDIFNNKLFLMVIVPFLKMIERYTIKKASHLNLISKGFLPYFEHYDVKKSFFTNGIDPEFIAFKWSKKINMSNNNKIILYAGNIGEGQGLEHIIPDIASHLRNYTIRIIGDGQKKKVLENTINKLCLGNVELLPPVERSKLIIEYDKADFLFLHLNDIPAFHKVLPSKIFEYAATHKPIIAGVSGYSKKFIMENICDSMVFSPCDFNEFKERFNRFSPIDCDRSDFINKFARSNIDAEMASVFLSLKGRNIE